MRKYAYSFFLLCSVLAAPVFAGSQTGQVTQLITRSSDGLIYFFMSGTGSGRPACTAGNSYWMVKDEESSTGMTQFAMLLSARETGKSITVYGAGTCTRWKDGEDVDSLVF